MGLRAIVGYDRAMTSDLTPATPPSVPPPTAPATTVAPPPVAAAPPVGAPPVVVQRTSGPGFLVRAIWFLLVGWWLSGIVTGIAYVLCITIIGMPFGFALFNLLPAVLTLRPRTEVVVTEVRDGVTYVRGGTVPQLPMLVRALWFIFVGWWLGALYSGFAWFLCVIIITLPIGLWLYNRIGAVMTLLRY